MHKRPTRRRFLKSAGAATTAAVGGGIFPVCESGKAQTNADDQTDQSQDQPSETYETQAKGIRIFPGEWRPHYPWEQIAWISPSWPSQDYIWLDFPEALFTNKGLLFLSHINPPIHTVFHNLPKVPWVRIPGGIKYERELPNGVSFGGTVKKGKGSTVDLELHLRNGTSEALKNITLQTCAFLRGIREFGDYTRENKFVHSPSTGWMTLEQARTMTRGSEKYRVGWRTSGNPLADLPVTVTLSNQADRLFAITWLEDTLSLVSNPNHPCVHADPRFKDLAPAEEASIRGKLIFFNGPLEEFEFDKYS